MTSISGFPCNVFDVIVSHCYLLTYFIFDYIIPIGILFCIVLLNFI